MRKISTVECNDVFGGTGEVETLQLPEGADKQVTASVAGNVFASKRPWWFDRPVVCPPVGVVPPSTGGLKQPR